MTVNESVDIFEKNIVKLVILNIDWKFLSAPRIKKTDADTTYFFIL